MMIAAGIRQVHKDADGNKIVKFDQGIYKVPEKAQIEKREGEEWVWCEAHADAGDVNEADDPKDKGGKKAKGNYALIGGQRVPLAMDPDLADDE
jgi:hypothetical protein